MVIDSQVPGQHQISISVFFFSMGEEGWDSSWEGNNFASYRVLVRGAICFLSSLVFILESMVGLPAETGLLSPCGALPTCNNLPISSPPFPCGFNRVGPGTSSHLLRSRDGSTKQERLYSAPGIRPWRDRK